MEIKTDLEDMKKFENFVKDYFFLFQFKELKLLNSLELFFVFLKFKKKFEKRFNFEEDDFDKMNFNIRIVSSTFENIFLFFFLYFYFVNKKKKQKERTNKEFFLYFFKKFKKKN